MILCDIGNTTFHFLINGKHKKYFLDEKIPKFKEDIFYISVNEKATKKLIKRNPKAKDLSKFVNFKTDYLGMGIDRIFASLYQENSIIVDAGSAITIDIVENSKHTGGFILLGLNSIKNGYKNISPILEQQLETNINLDNIPLNTKDAISYATLKSIILPIKEICKDRKIIFTGGDGEFLSQFFENCTYKKDLIFENMKRIIDAHNCTA